MHLLCACRSFASALSRVTPTAKQRWCLRNSTLRFTVAVPFTKLALLALYVLLLILSLYRHISKAPYWPEDILLPPTSYHLDHPKSILPTRHW